MVGPWIAGETLAAFKCGGRNPHQSGPSDLDWNDPNFLHPSVPQTFFGMDYGRRTQLYLRPTDAHRGYSFHPLGSKP
ncbi:hypothetical protein OSCI_280008 [Kamptonema sp. PCC 6506]|nr:hypothetical protein OSCI_280008 [Kamptonema sp. PCC 6506]